MSVLSPKRAILFVAATLLALPLFANNPSPRLNSRMAFDEQSGTGVLFGGRGIVDPADTLIHATSETWLWVRTQWVQQFPTIAPPARSEHSMVYDSKRGRVLVFGGRREGTVAREKFGYLNDTWAWKDGSWQDLAPGDAPTARQSSGIAYDRDRDRVVLFGGINYAADGKTFEPRYDTWEYDGDNWAQVSQNGPEIARPLLVFDVARHETLMVGLDTSGDVAMYGWDPDAKTWRSKTPAALPTCANDAGMVYQAHNQKVFLAGGACAAVGFLEQVWEWDGTNWTKPETNAFSRIISGAYAYDTFMRRVVRFGGNSAFASTPDELTATYQNGRWRSVITTAKPDARSMPVFRRDPVRDTIWLLGGLSQYSYGSVIGYLDDFWSYRDGTWSDVAFTTGQPLSCTTPISAFDTDRSVLVVVCNGSSVAEWNGTEWKKFTDLSVEPVDRRFGALAYDKNIKKVVMFGGYDTSNNYRQDTWTWNGTAWTEVKPSKKPPHRGQATMWYDPLASRTIIYSGAGRGSIEDKATRYSDMWAFDGTNWSELSPSAAPGIRFAPQVAVHPETGKVVMFGGLRATIDPNDEDIVTQFYDNDMWIWDGAAKSWTELDPENAPPARQNAAFEYDSASGKFVLFAGFSGNIYLSDRWLWDGQNWTVVPDSTVGRRAVRR